MGRHVLLFGLVGGVLIAGLKLIDYSWLVVEHSVEIYGALVAALVAGFGIWLGQRSTRRRREVVVREVRGDGRVGAHDAAPVGGVKPRRTGAPYAESRAGDRSARPDRSER